MRPSSSSVRASISSWVNASRLSRSSGSVFEGRTLKCQVPQSTETPSSQRHLAVRVALGDLLHLRVLVVDRRVDLARDEVLAPVGLQQLGHRLAADRQQLEHQQRRDHARVGAPEVAEVVVARDLAAERRVRSSRMRVLKKAWPTRFTSALPPGRLDGVGHGAARAHVVEDRRARVLGEDRLGEQRREEVARHELAVVVDEEAAVARRRPRRCRARRRARAPCR